MNGNTPPRRRRLYALGALAAVAALATMPARADDTAPTIGQGGASATDVGEQDLSSAPNLPSAPMPAGFVANMPTMPITEYRAAKAARPAPATDKGATQQLGPSVAATGIAARVVNETQTGLIPPDGDIASNSCWSVQLVNTEITINNWCTGAFTQKSLATFFRDSTRFLFDPRVVYDQVWNRWVVMADACTSCLTASNISSFDIAFSQTSDPTGAYFIYNFLIGTGTGDFGDFPQLGMDLNSIIFTYNDFLANGGFSANTFAVAKAYFYNGGGQFVPVFGGSGCTNAPPYVEDNNGRSYILAFCPADNKIFVGYMQDSGLSTVSLHLWDGTVGVAHGGSLPPNAPQPNVNYPLDTGDNRFENRSAQIGERIWNVNVVLDGTATSQWYEINGNFGGAPSLVASSIWFATGSSSDWHPSIVVNSVPSGCASGVPTGETFGTWMSTDVPNTTFLNLRAIGSTCDSAGVGAGIVVLGSTAPLTGQTDNIGRNRSGDYSYISLYPAPALGCTNANELGILEGEVTLNSSPSNWAAGIAVVKHC
jgi:hypothetical protein